MMRALYALGTTVGGPVIYGFLRHRLRRGKEHPNRFGERLGKPGRLRPEERLLWVHGASVGECLSVLPLIERFLTASPGWSVMLTSGTVTSAELMAQRLPERAFHQFIPVDRLPWVRRFLDHWRPDAAVWLESEFWPNLISEAQRRAIPLALVNGRVSERSLRSWKRLPGFIAGLLSAFTVVLGQTDDDAARLNTLGAKNARCLGNLKAAAPPLPVDETALVALETAIAGRPCWLAASTHPGEESAAWYVHRQLQEAFPSLLTIVVPRHPQRGAEIAADLASAGAEVALRSTGGMPDARTSVYIADTMGELGLFYRLCPVVFVGKSLPDMGHTGGGQNPLEPARLGCAVVFGRMMENFATLAETMTRRGAARQVADSDALAETIGWLLRDQRARHTMAAAGQGMASAEAEVLDRTLAALAPLFPTPEAHRAGS